jgi:hypothetical protein
MFGHGCFGRDELVVCFLGGWPTDSPPEDGGAGERVNASAETERGRGVSVRVDGSGLNVDNDWPMVKAKIWLVLQG